MQSRLRVFISAATADFPLPVREELRKKLVRGGCDVAVQHEFPQSEVNTLEKLDQIISECNAVVHIVGDKCGATPNAIDVSSYLSRDDSRQFLSGLDVCDQLRLQIGDFNKLTYTQWEAFQALHRAIPLFVYTPQNRDEQFRQDEHLTRLETAGRYATSFSGHSDLISLVMADLMDYFRRNFAKDLLPLSLRQPNNLPFRSIGEWFRGREGAVTELDRGLRRGSQSRAHTGAAQVICGMGGVGKTRLAVEFAWRHVDDYSALLFASADSVESLNQSLAEMIGPRVLDVKTAQGVVEQDFQVAAAETWLQTHSDWLLILDNVDDVVTMQEVQSLVSRLTNGHLLVTSRLANWGRSINCLALDTFTDADGRDFLLDSTAPIRAVRDDDYSQATAIAKELDGLPLAFEQVATYIEQLGISFATYRERWDQQREKVLALFDEQVVDYGASLATTWGTSIEQLPQAAILLLQHLSWLDSEPIPEFLFDEMAARQLWSNQLDGADVLDARRHLLKYSLIKRDFSGEAPSVSMHRLLQDYVRGRLADADQSDRIGGIVEILQAAMRVGETATSSSPIRALIPHVEYLLGIEDKLDSHALVAADVFQIAGNWLVYGTSLHRRAQPLIYAFLRLVRKHAVNPYIVGLGLPAAASVAWYDANYDLALELVEETRQISYSENFLPSARIRGLQIEAILYNDLGYYGRSERVFDEALSICENELSETTAECCWLWNDKAWLLRDIGRFGEAEELLKKVLETTKTDGESHSYGIANNNLAYVYESSGQLNDAERHNSLALELLEPVIGRSNKYYAHALNVRGDILRKQGKVSGAIEVLSEALQIQMDLVAHQHPHTAMIHWSLGEAYLSAGQHNLAEDHASRSLETREVLFPEPHPKIASSLRLLNRIYSAQGRPQLCRKMQHRADMMDREHRQQEINRQADNTSDQLS